MSLEALPEFPCPQNPNPSFCSSLLSHPPPFLPSSAHARLLTRWRCEAGEGLSNTASAACHFIVLGRIFSYFSLSRFHSCPRYRHWPNPCPSSPSCGCAYSRSSAPPKGDRAQAQLEVLLFFPSHLFSQSTFFFFCLALIFDSLAWTWRAPSVVGLRLVRFFLSFPRCSPVCVRLCSEQHPSMCVSVDHQGCGWEQLPAAATILRAVHVKCRW